MPNQFSPSTVPKAKTPSCPARGTRWGLSLWGRIKDWRYELQLLPGLDADRMNNHGWIHNAAGSPYEYKIATAYAGALRIDNYSVRGLRIGVSGYIGNSASNSLKHTQL